MKITLRIALSVLIAGILLMSLGTAMGAKKYIYFENGRVQVSEPKEEKKISEILEPFSDIEVDILSSDIEFITTENEFKIEILNNERFDWKNKDDTLKIKELPGFGNNFTIDLRFLFYRERDDNLKIYIPKDTNFDDVRVVNKSGDISIGNFTADEVRIKNMSGDIDIEYINAEKITIDNISGDLEAIMISAEKCEVKLVSGDIEMENVVFERFTAGNTSGNISVTGNLNKSEFKLVSGDIDLKLSGKYEDYSTNVNNKSGDLYINGKRSRDFESSPSKARKSIEVNIISGDTKLSFDD